MRLKLMTLRYSSTLGGFDETPLERFVSDKEVLGFKEHFFLVNDIPHLLCVVTWRLLESAATAERATAPEGRGRRGARPDPCEGLDEGQRRAFESLRAWRLDKAHRDGVPPYVVLTNKELGAIVRAADSLKGTTSPDRAARAPRSAAGTPRASATPTSASAPL